MKIISEIDAQVSKKLEIVATDVDGTITYGGRITERTIQSLRALNESGLKTLLVTGRSAGFGLSLMTYLPGLTAVIAENGGVIIADERVVWARGRTPRLQEAVASLSSIWPNLRQGNDNFSRLSDYTFDIRSLMTGDLASTREYIRDRGLGSTYSTVHLHVYDGEDSKGVTLRRWLRTNGVNEDAVFTVGDSANDESLVDVDRFQNCCWVGNAENATELGLRPTYVTRELEGAGFEEIARVLSLARQSVE